MSVSQKKLEIAYPVELTIALSELTILKVIAYLSYLMQRKIRQAKDLGVIDFKQAPNAMTKIQRFKPILGMCS